MEDAKRGRMPAGQWVDRMGAMGKGLGIEAGIRLRLSLCLTLLLAASCTTGKPGTSFRSYKVAGENHETFVRSVHAAAPRSGRAYGLTEITFHPSYTVAETRGGCAVTKADVGMEIVVILPEWRKGAPPPAVRARWSRFERTIRGHEMTHVAIAKAYGQRLERMLATMRSTDGCADLRRRISAEIARTKRAHLAAHAAYDVRDRRRINALLK